MLDLLIEGDHRKCRKFWAEHMPQMPQVSTDEEAEIVMHQARTMSLIPMNLRLWSHRWLVERNYPSLLPADLIMRANKLEVIETRAVGISVSALEPKLQPAADIIRVSMEDAVKDMSLNNPDNVRTRLKEVYERESNRLFGGKDGR